MDGDEHSHRMGVHRQHPMESQSYLFEIKSKENVEYCAEFDDDEKEN